MKKLILCVAVLFAGLLFCCKEAKACTAYDILPRAGSELYLGYEEDMRLLAQLVRAEAGNQSLEGKQAVVDVILNRVDSPQFPDTVKDVIFQPGQFSCVDNGWFDKALYLVDDSDYRAVVMERNNRANDDIYFFNSGTRCMNGEFAMKIGDHYFGTL